MSNESTPTPSTPEPPAAPVSRPAQPTGSDKKGAIDNSGNWARPVAQARDRHLGSWLVFLSIICFVIAFFSPLNRLYWHIRNRLASAPENLPRTADCFLAISYEAVSQDSDPEGFFTTTARFSEHLKALREAGYHPIGLEDVRAFYKNGTKFPEKSILTTFENTHKSTFFDATPVLRSYNWHGVLGVVTRHVREKSPDSVLAPYLGEMILDNTWELACESDSGADLIQASSHGRTALYLSSPMWLPDENRPERPEEFEARVKEDHERALAVFRDTLKMTPIAYFFPLGNYGQYEERNRVLRAINLAAVQDHYDISFLLGSHALNTAETDHRRLNRLRIPPEWPAKTLIDRLENEWPSHAREKNKDGLVPPELWTPDWGVLEKDRRSSTIHLRALAASNPMRTDADATGGARAWIAGTDGFREGSLDVRFLLLRGEFHIYLPFASDDDWLRVEIGDTGHATVRHCAHGSDPAVISTGAIVSVADFRSTHSLLLNIRDGLLFVRLDNEPLFGGPVTLPPNFSPGIVGAGVWSETPGLAQTDIFEIHLRPRFDGLVTWAPSLAHDAEYLARYLQRNAFRHTVISPPWLDVYASSPVSYPPFDSAAISVIATTSHALVMPAIIPHDTTALITLDPGEIAGRIANNRISGVFIDAAEYPAEGLSQLKEWFTRLRSVLARRERRLAIRFPTAVQNLAAVANFLADMNDVLVVNDDGQAPPGIPPSRVLALLRIDPPASDEDLALFYQLSNYNARDVDEIPEATLLRQQGLRAYSEGRYAEAVGYWKKWAAADPDDAEAWTLLGNACNRLRDTDGALQAYSRSLEIAPGQIDLALERVRLLEQAGKTAECEEFLDIYARAFPGDSRIVIAQALWLDRHGRRSAGREILTELVRRNPANINARLALQSLLDNPSARYANMHELLTVGTSGTSGLLGFGHDITSAELLTCPEASVFFDFLRDTAANAPQESIRELYADFLPLTDSIVEQFDASRLSDNWTALGTPLAAIAGTYDLRAGSDMSEAYLRLKRSDLLRDGFIEVTLSESVGAFWLYARRSSRHLVRFGFDGDGFLRIQTWSDGELRTGDSRAWNRPGGDVTLRLEIRGDGAIGIVDGKPAFSTALPIPKQIAYGWWSVAPFSPELGIARARISRIAAGPLASTIAVLRETDVARAADDLDRLRPRAGELSAISPVLFAQRQDGSLPATPLADLMPFRMFCSYHRLRLVPSVALDYDSYVTPESLVRIIREHRLDGLVIHVRARPSAEWFKATTSLLESTSADLIVVISEKPLLPADPDPDEAAATTRVAALPPVTLIELQRGSLLLHPSQKEWSVPATPFLSWPPAGRTSETANPRLIVFPHASEEKAEDSPNAEGTEEASPPPAPESPDKPETPEAPETPETPPPAPPAED